MPCLVGISGRFWLAHGAFWHLEGTSEPGPGQKPTADARDPRVRHAPNRSPTPKSSLVILVIPHSKSFSCSCRILFPRTAAAQSGGGNHMLDPPSAIAFMSLLLGAPTPDGNPRKSPLHTHHAYKLPARSEIRRCGSAGEASASASPSSSFAAALNCADGPLFARGAMTCFPSGAQKSQAALSFRRRPIPMTRNARHRFSCGYETGLYAPPAKVPSNAWVVRDSDQAAPTPMLNQIPVQRQG